MISAKPFGEIMLFLSYGALRSTVFPIHPIHLHKLFAKRVLTPSPYACILQLY